MIALDAKGDAIWIQVPKTKMNKFVGKIEEQKTYLIRNFDVVKEEKGFRPVPCDMFIEFSSGTTMVLAADVVPPFREHCFRFLKHEDMYPNRGQRILLLDVVGQLTEHYRTRESTSTNRNSNHKEITIMLLEGIPVKVVLWGRLPSTLEKIIDASNNRNVVLVITSVFVSEWNEELKLSSSGATIIYDRLNLKERLTFEFILSFVFLMIITVDNTPKLIEQEKRQVVGPLLIEELKALTSDYANKNKIVAVNCKANDVLTEWHYDGREKCLCKVESESNKFHCKKCRLTMNHSFKRFKIELAVSYVSGEAIFVILDKEGKRFFGISAQTLFADAENDSTVVPSTIAKIQKLELQFLVILKEYNFKTSAHEFSVLQINDIRSNMTTIHSAIALQPSLSALDKANSSSQSIASSMSSDHEVTDLLTAEPSENPTPNSEVQIDTVRVETICEKARVVLNAGDENQDPNTAREAATSTKKNYKRKSQDQLL
ncbi:unnamed protein product [Linum trigynum]|uniref:Replication factor A C-terminal domain-containing protein n=1 Tax=Linum trigynum TaxID=586398 RepID=A0AAV2GML1_9ROSI